VAASVVTEDTLARANASDISDINMLVPSVQLKGTFNGRMSLAMRGISTNANEAHGAAEGKGPLVQDVTAQSTYFLNQLRDGFIPPPPFGPPLFDNTQGIKVVPKSLTQEFRIASPLNQPVSYVGGLFYSDVDVTQDTNRVMFVNPKIDHVTSSTKSLGLYGRVTWKLAADTGALTGLRYNRDQVAYTIADLARNFKSANRDSASTVVGDLTLRQKLGADHMVYGTYSRGYKPRAFNTAATLSKSEALAPVEREDIDHLEFGAKSVLMKGALTLNLAAFNTTYKNFQVQLYPPGQIIPSLDLANGTAGQQPVLQAEPECAVRLPHFGLAASQPEPAHQPARLRHPQPGPDGDAGIGVLQRHRLRQQRAEQVLPGQRRRLLLGPVFDPRQPAGRRQCRDRSAGTRCQALPEAAAELLLRLRPDPALAGAILARCRPPSVTIDAVWPAPGRPSCGRPGWRRAEGFGGDPARRTGLRRHGRRQARRDPFRGGHRGHVQQRHPGL
jgi:hypothetical protein